MPETTTELLCSAKTSKLKTTPLVASLETKWTKSYSFLVAVPDAFTRVFSFCARFSSSAVKLSDMTVAVPSRKVLLSGGGGGGPTFHFLRRRTARAVLLINGSPVNVKSYQFGNRRNEGWSGTVNLRFPELPPSSVSPQTKFRFVLEDQFNGVSTTVRSGLMACLNRQDSHDARKSSDVTYPLVDYSLKQLAKPGQSWSTFLNQNAKSSLASVVAGTGVELRGAPSFWVTHEDAKQQKAIDVIRRFASAAGLDIIVGEDGFLYFVRATSIQGLFPRKACKSLNRNWDDTRLATGIWIEKPRVVTEKIEFKFSTSDFHTATLPYGFLRCDFRDTSADGWIDLISMWNGDPRANGKLIDIRSSGIVANTFFSTVPFNGIPPITHIGVNVYKSILGQLTGEQLDATLEVSGMPFKAENRENQTGFSQFFGSPEWPFSEPWSEPLIPDQGFAAANSSEYIWQRGRDYCTYSATWGHLVEGQVGQSLELRLRGVDYPRAQVSYIGWSGQPNTITSQAEANLITF